MSWETLRKKFIRKPPNSTWCTSNSNSSSSLKGSSSSCNSFSNNSKSSSATARKTPPKLRGLICYAAFKTLTKASLLARCIRNNWTIWKPSTMTSGRLWRSKIQTWETEKCHTLNKNSPWFLKKTNSTFILVRSINVLSENSHLLRNFEYQQ